MTLIGVCLPSFAVERVRPADIASRCLLIALLASSVLAKCSIMSVIICILVAVSVPGRVVPVPVVFSATMVICSWRYF